MRVLLNGKERELPAGMTAAGLLEHLGLERGRVVLERNHEVVARADLGQVELADDDTLEVIQMMAGG